MFRYNIGMPICLAASSRPRGMLHEGRRRYLKSARWMETPKLGAAYTQTTPLGYGEHQLPASTARKNRPAWKIGQGMMVGRSSETLKLTTWRTTTRLEATDGDTPDDEQQSKHDLTRHPRNHKTDRSSKGS